jgi:hypothetical protein
MPPEYYLGIGIAAVLVLLLGMLLQRWLGTRFVVLHKSSGTDQLAQQLSRIADSLEKLAVQPGLSPPAEKLAVDKTIDQPRVEQPRVDQAHIDQPRVEQPPVEKPSIPPQAAPQPSETDEKKAEQPPERHVRLSMFGR